MVNIPELNSFLDELMKLCDKYEIYIGGCGCCGSPYLYGKDGAGIADNLNIKDDHYSIENTFIKRGDSVLTDMGEGIVLDITEKDNLKWYTIKFQDSASRIPYTRIFSKIFKIKGALDD